MDPGQNALREFAAAALAAVQVRRVADSSDAVDHCAPVNEVDTSKQSRLSGRKHMHTKRCNNSSPRAVSVRPAYRNEQDGRAGAHTGEGGGGRQLFEATNGCTNLH